MAIGFKPQQRRGLFGSAMAVPQSSMMQGVNLQQPMPQMEPQQQNGGGFFGQGGAGRGIAGAIGDYLLQFNGMRPIYAPQRQYQQHMQNQQKLAEQQRMAAREDKMWEWNNKPQDAPNPPAIQQNAEYIRQTRGEAAANEYLDNYGRGQVQPNVVSIPGLGTFYGTPEEVAAGIAAARGGTSPTTVSQSDWDSAKPMGGTARNGGGGF